MFYYLLARNVNIIKNVEQVASITILKYIALLVIMKIVEYHYFEIGFFNLYLGIFLVADFIFSAYYHYSLTFEKENNVFWNDDVIDDDFSVSKHESEIARFREEFNKRKQTETKINGDETIHTETDDSGLDTIDLGNAINKIISENPSVSKPDSSIDSECSMHSMFSIGNNQPNQINILENLSDKNILSTNSNGPIGEIDDRCIEERGDRCIEERGEEYID